MGFIGVDPTQSQPELFLEFFVPREHVSRAISLW